MLENCLEYYNKANGILNSLVNSVCITPLKIISSVLALIQAKIGNKANINSVL